MKQIIAALCLITILCLTSCAPAKRPADLYEDGKQKMQQDMNNLQDQYETQKDRFQENVNEMQNR